jgi:hypothetical protein
VKWLAAAVAGVITAELLARVLDTGIHVRMTRTTRRSLRTLARSGVSDHWKERVMLHHARLLFLDTLKLGLLFGLIVGAVAVIAVVARAMDIELMAFLVDPVGVLYVTGVATVYVLLRRRRVL